jgi:prefoldin alpha subunit|tara:strand:- start:50 stop:442 length:393 start_codon:yes stop_codon:yes gene_type:complete
MEEKNQQEILYKLSLIEQQMQGLHQQLHAVEKGIVELGTLNVGLEEFENPIGKEIIAPLGKGIFTKAKIISEDLIVDIGNKNLIKKSSKETQELIEKQIGNLEGAKEELNKNLEATSKEAEEVIKNFKKE